MRKQGFAWSNFAVLVTLIVVGCAPTPVPTVATPMPVAATPAVTQAAPSISPEDASWAKVVEAAKKEGKINAYVVTWTGDIGQAISKGFQARYGIAVDIITGRTPEFVERLKTEGRMGQINADMTEGGQLAVFGEDALASTGDILPVLREKGVWLSEPALADPKKKAILMYRFNYNYAWINTRLVKPAEVPNSWNELLDPKWKGKMSLQDPRLETTFYVQLSVPLLDKKIWNESYITALFRQDLIYVRSVGPGMTMLANGENSLMLTGTDAMATTYIQGGATIRPIDMKEGMTVLPGGIAAIRGGPHPNATLLFLNWLLGPEGQTAYGKTRGSLMVRSDVPDFRLPELRVKITNPVFITQQYSDQASALFRDKWVEKLVGR